jgi:hypothetical protein
VTYTEPTLDQLAGLLRSCSQKKADTSLTDLLNATGGTVDLTLSGDRGHLLRWLNKWLCRLRYPLPGEPDIFSDSLLQWLPASGAVLPANPIAELIDVEIDMIADAYADLSARPAALRTHNGAIRGHRRIGPTAASKIMFILRRDTVQPWDAAIARTATGGTSRNHFASHLEASRTWAQNIQNEARRRHIPDIATYVGRPNSSMAKLRDEWMYLTITRRRHVP